MTKRILLAVDFEIEADMLEDIIRHGHTILDRVTGAAALAEHVLRSTPDIVVAQSGPETLTAQSLSACDRAGARTIAVYTDSLERRQAIELGIMDRVDARDGWAPIEALLQQQGAYRSGTQPPALPGSESAAMFPGAAPGTPGSLIPMSQPSQPYQAGASLPPGQDGDDQQHRGRGGTRRRAASREMRKHRERRRPRPNGQPQPSPQLNAAAPMPPHSAGPIGTHQLGGPVPNTSPAPLGQIIAVWGPHGAPGRTTCAIAIATELAKCGYRTVLVDADIYGGAIGQLLGITDEAPGIAAACRLAGAQSLTASELDRLSAEVRCSTSRLRVLTGINNPARWPELTRERIRGVLDQLREWVDVIVVDVGFNLEHDEELLSDVAAPRRNAVTLTVLERADRILAIGEATPVGLQRFLRGRLALVDLAASPDRIDVVMNRVRRGMHGADTGTQVREVLRRFGGIERVTLLPDDAKACDRAITMGAAVTEVSPRSALAKQYVALSARMRQELRGSAAEVA
ncbi:AAA family ATPase [Gulosibacter bifidus]|uniref:P-loop NTPase n=1 Tax=Gulosibacter bifidus TaxID=272239 RepID=A0ABW5RKC2_9MICO|nr:P-loop NTPase [Gulosibacter bifidus]